MLKRLFIISVFLVAGLLLFCATVLVLLPADVVGFVLTEKASEYGGIKFKYDMINRDFPFGIEATGVEIKRPSDKIDIYIDRVRLRFNLVKLFYGRFGLLFDADLLGGTVEGIALLGSNGLDSEVRVKSISPDLHPLATVYGVRVPLTVSGRLDFFMPYSGCVAGRAVFDSDEAGSGLFSALGFGLDFGAGTVAGLRAELADCKVNIKGLWVEGADLVARLSGGISQPLNSGSSFDLVAELNERRPNRTNRLPLSFIGQYRESEGYYGFKITGTPLRPAVRRLE